MTLPFGYSLWRQLAPAIAGVLTGGAARQAGGVARAAAVLAERGRISATGDATLLLEVAFGLTRGWAPAHVGTHHSFRGHAWFAPAAVDAAPFHHARGQHGSA